MSAGMQRPKQDGKKGGIQFRAPGTDDGHGMVGQIQADVPGKQCGGRTMEDEAYTVPEGNHGCVHGSGDTPARGCSIITGGDRKSVV